MLIKFDQEWISRSNDRDQEQNVMEQSLSLQIIRLPDSMDLDDKRYALLTNEDVIMSDGQPLTIANDRSWSIKILWGIEPLRLWYVNLNIKSVATNRNNNSQNISLCEHLLDYGIQY